MSRAIGGLGAFVNGLAQGYGTVMKFNRELDDDKARQEDRDYQREQRERTRAQQKDEDELKANVKAASAPTAVEDAPVGYQPDVDDDGNAMPPNPTAGQYAVRGVRFDSKDKAQRAADADNSSAAVYDRVAEAYKKAGRVDLYEAHKRMATAARDEGAAEFADAIRAGSPALADVQAAKAGYVNHELSADALRNFNGMGKWKLPDDVVSQAFVAKDITGKDVLDHRLVRPDGTVVLSSLNEATDFLGLSSSERRAARKDDARLGLDVKRTDAQIKHQGDQLQLQRDTNKSTAAYQDRMAGVAERNAATQEAYRRDQIKVAEDKIAAGKTGAGAGAPTIWQDKDDDYLRKQYLVEDPATGQKSADGHGMRFAKQLAIAASRDRFGGDTTQAIGFALDVDAKIRKEANGDPAALRAGRERMLASLSAPSVKPVGDMTPVAAGGVPAAAVPARAAVPAGAAGAASAGVALPWNQPNPANQAVAMPPRGAMAVGRGTAPPQDPASQVAQVLAGGAAHNSSVLNAVMPSAQQLVQQSANFTQADQALRQAVQGRASPEVLRQAAGVKQAAINAISETLKDQPPAQQQAILNALGISL